MYKGKQVAVVIPAYNEEGLVGTVIQTLPEFVDRAYVVDDCSTDGTWNEIRRYATALNAANSGQSMADGGGYEPRVVAISHEENSGVGAAIKTGYRRAYEDGMDAIAVMNGDAQMDPSILDRILDPVVEGRAEYAKGNRLLSREHTKGMGSWRRFGNGILTFLTKIASGYWKTMDPQNGYTAISHRALERLDIDSLYDEFGFCNDILVKLNANNLRVADVEMDAIYGEETSSIRYTQFIPTVSMLLLRDFVWRLKVRYLVYDFHPLVLLYLLGSAGFGIAIGHLGLSLAGYMGSLSDWLLTALVVLVSGFALTLAMTFDLMNNQHLEVQVLETEEATYRARSRPTMRVGEQSD